jgi:ketosteroid isomerase-like protein
MHMIGELQQVVRNLFDLFDKQDFSTVQEMFAKDAQGIDEISREWMRSSTELRDYIAQLGSMLSNIHSRVDDLTEVQWGDTGVVTCWLEQDYVLDGKPDHVSAPTTIVLRREDGDWKVVLVHSVPLPTL